MAPKPMLIPVPDVPNRRHPAYAATFEAYLRSGGHVTRALELLEEMWDANLYGAEMPSPQAVRMWVREDNWEPICRDYALRNKPKIKQAINSDILLTAMDMLQVVKNVAHDENPDHAKINSVRMGAARTILLDLAGAGIRENQRGDIPEYDIEGEEALARVRSMTPEEIMEAETKEIRDESA